MRDYRRFLSAHLQFLTGLCELSTKSVHDYIQQFLSSFHITPQLLSKSSFRENLMSLLKHKKSNIRTALHQIQFLIRSINNGNGVISNYGTNYEYTLYSPPFSSYDTLIHGQTYDDECSCESYQNCTTQAIFINANSDRRESIRGFKMGCLPSESLLSSTLECFYDPACIRLIQEYTNCTNCIDFTVSSNRLSTNQSRFSINTTVAELMDELFVEDWQTSSNYSSYYHQCAPSLCTYTFTQQFNSFYTVSALISIQGGLAIIFKWITPKLVLLSRELNERRKKRSDKVHPLAKTPTTCTIVVNHGSLRGLQSSSTTTAAAYVSSHLISMMSYMFYVRTNVVSTNRYYLRNTLSCLLVVAIVFPALFLFSLLFARHQNKTIMLTGMILLSVIYSLRY